MKSIVAVCAFFIFSSVAFSLTGSETILKTCKDTFPQALQGECKTIVGSNTFNSQAVGVCGKAFHRYQDLMTCWKTIANRQYLPDAPIECHNLAASSSYLYYCLETKSQAPRNLR